MAAGVLYPTMADAGIGSEQSMQQRGMFIGTPEIYFTKRIDNSRVVRITDPKRRREMASFAAVLSLFFLFVMVYVWQHFSAIDYGYKIERLKAEGGAIAASTRTLHLEEASLKDVSRIERMARQMGMQPPVDGQWQPLDSSADPATPVMARAGGMVISGLQ
jgi:cell division protein FtsL